MASNQDIKLEERKTFHENGQLWSREFYRNGEREGERKFWYSNGQPMVREFYRNGKREGKRKSWINDNIWEQEFYRDGEPIDINFTGNKQKPFFRIKRLFRNRAIYQINQMLISDLVKTIN